MRRLRGRRDRQGGTWPAHLAVARRKVIEEISLVIYLTTIIIIIIGKGLAFTERGGSMKEGGDLAG